MSFDLQSLSSEPLVYMFLHSGLFVSVLGAVFFLIGLLFGRATWGRYKRQTRELLGEASAMKAEIADLKRKLAEFAMKSGPAVAMMTETIPMPRKDAAEPAPGPSSSPVIAARSAEASASEIRVQPNGALVPEILKVSNGSATPELAASPLATIVTPPVSPSLPRREGGAALKEAVSALPEIPDFKPVPVPTTPGLTLPLFTGPIPSAVVEAEDGELPEPFMLEEEPAAAPEQDPALGTVYRRRPEQVDDLTALKGIAKPLEHRLQALGIYTYEQISSWTDDQIKEVSSRLAFKDRIQRELWVEQARELLAARDKTQTEPVVVLPSASSA